MSLTFWDKIIHRFTITHWLWHMWHGIPWQHPHPPTNEKV